MAEKTKYRINIFNQLNAFYSKVFSGEHKFTPHHISLYMFLLNQNNRNNWVEWFKMPFDLAMAGACVGSKKTYYKTLTDLQEWGLVQYNKGSNEWKAPEVRIEVLKCTATIPQSEIVEVHNHTSTRTSTDTSGVPQSEPQLPSLPTTLRVRDKDSITSNLITDNLITYNNIADKPLHEKKKSDSVPKGVDAKNESEEKKENVPPKEKNEDSTHAKCRDYYTDFCKKNEIECYWTGAYGKALKEILKKITFSFTTRNTREPTEDELIHGFKFLIDKLPTWHRNKNLQIISSHYGTIVTEIRTAVKASPEARSKRIDEQLDRHFGKK